MTISPVAKFLNSDKFDEKSQSLIQSYFSLNVFMRSAILITNTFYILFIIELVNYQQAAVLISIGFVAQAIIDYPTGVLADLLGHKWVLFASYIAHAIAFSMLGLISYFSPDNIFGYLTIIYIIESFALAQESGALQSWFDNNYKNVVGYQDANRETYRIIYGKTLMILRLIGGLGIFLGGALSTSLGSRESVFLIQAGFMLLLAFIFLSTMKDYSSSEKPKVSVKAYAKLLFLGVGIIFQNKIILLFALSFVVLIVTSYIWVSILVFPIYFGYTGSDSLASSLRTILFLTGALITGFGTSLTKKMDPRKWLPLTLLINAVVFYGIYVLVLFLYPLSTEQQNATLSIIPLVFVFVAAAIGSLLSTIGMLLFQRVMVDLIPDESRNSFYSLAPTIGLLISAILVPKVGIFLQNTQDFSLVTFLFLMLPSLMGVTFAFLAMRSYTPSEIDHHPHPVFTDDTLFINMKNVFKIALPKDLADEKDLSATWYEFVDSVTSHVGNDEDIHGFLDQIMEDLFAYNDRYTELRKKKQFDMAAHNKLGILRKDLTNHVAGVLEKHKMSQEEELLLKKLIHLLHRKEHELAKIETPKSDEQLK